MTRAEALEILGLDSDASLDDARKAYRALAKAYHPDKSLASNATVIFRIISDTWEIIQNTAEQEYTETEVMSRYTKAEEERKRFEEEPQQAEAKAAHAEEIRRHKEKKIEKKIKRFCYLGWFLLTFLSVLEILKNQNVLSLIIIIYIIYIVCLGTVGYGWLTGWFIVKFRKKVYKSGTKENIEFKILCLSCIVYFIIIFSLYWWNIGISWDSGQTGISELVFILQLANISIYTKFLMFIVSTNIIFIVTIFIAFTSSVLLGTLLSLLGRIIRSIIIKTNTWFKKKGLKN